MGVKEIFIDDLREEFVKDYVFPMFRYRSCRCKVLGDTNVSKLDWTSK